jgi:hypothetical protein
MVARTVSWRVGNINANSLVAEAGMKIELDACPVWQRQ